LKKQFSRRAAIEPVIGHLKTDNRMRRNYYKGITGDAINIMLSSAGYNFKRMMRKWSAFFGFYLILTLFRLPALPSGRLFHFSIKFYTTKKEIWVFKG